MEVILKQDVDKVGKAGSVVKVKDGFARNFLFPGGKAIPVNTQNLKIIEQDKQKKDQLLENARKDAGELAEKLKGLSLTMPVLTQSDETLYGSIGAQEISAALKEEGLTIDKALIILESPIKSLGIYEVPVKLHPEVVTKVKVWVVKK